eukprot:TRINITY_DN19301_c0_g1_i2.p1 TRINITY_DN19301_c0_g1~~TRINITY_DN19301_c0_g1_i2.p1  ORF type:complete len:177 (-),score=32.40 TRINITY_DN19301_c0_g1_i2:108-638(-)
MSSVNAPPAAPCLRPSVEPFELGDLPMFELPPSASVEEGSVDSSMKIYTLAAEAGMATTKVPPSAPRLRPSSPPVDLDLIPLFELPDSCELPHTFENSTVRATLPPSAKTVPTGCSVGEPFDIEDLLPFASTFESTSEMARSQCGFSVSWSVFPFSRKHKRETSPSTVSTSGSEIA